MGTWQTYTHSTVQCKQMWNKHQYGMAIWQKLSHLRPGLIQWLIDWVECKEQLQWKYRPSEIWFGVEGRIFAPLDMCPPPGQAPPPGHMPPSLVTSGPARTIAPSPLHQHELRNSVTLSIYELITDIDHTDEGGGWRKIKLLKHLLYFTL